MRHAASALGCDRDAMCGDRESLAGRQHDNGGSPSGQAGFKIANGEFSRDAFPIAEGDREMRFQGISGRTGVRPHHRRPRLSEKRSQWAPFHRSSRTASSRSQYREAGRL